MKFVAGVVWVFASILFLDVAISKIASLHAAGVAVSGWRYAQAGFWILMVPFFLWNAWQRWNEYRMERKVV